MTVCMLQLEALLAGGPPPLFHPVLHLAVIAHPAIPKFHKLEKHKPKVLCSPESCCLLLGCRKEEKQIGG